MDLQFCELHHEPDRHRLGVIDHQKSAVSRVIERQFGRFRNRTELAVADRLRSCSPRGVQALPKAPRHASELQKKANSSPLSLRLAISLTAIPLLRAHGDRDTVTPPSQIHQHRAPLTDSSKPQPRRELLYVCDPTATPFSPQVDLPVSVAPPGRHDRRRPSSHMAVLLEPLIAPSLPCASFCV